MTPEEIYSQFMKDDTSVLHLGCGKKTLKELRSFEQYVGVGLNEEADLNIDLNTSLDDIPGNFDYVVLDTILEVVNEPLELIKAAAKRGKMMVIYEFKYDEEDDYNLVQPHWKTPWKNTGLEYFLTQQFDWVNSVFMGHATLHMCTTPIGLDEQGDPTI